MRYVKSVLIVSVSIVLIFISTYHKVSALPLPKKSFGGKVILAPIPGVTCYGIGKITLTSSNIIALAATVAVAADKNSSAAGKVLKTAMALYNVIPTYTTNPLRVPTPFKSILGTENMIPDIKTCWVGDIPIPVLRTTTNYNVSKL